MMEWIGLGVLVPLLLCGGMCAIGAIAAFFGFRRVAESSQDAAGSTPTDSDDRTDWFDEAHDASRVERTGGRT